MTKTAITSAPLHPLLADRWSPRAFDTSTDLTDDQTSALLEAARWSPSASNSQPWRFLVARRGTADFARLFATLAEGNRSWAGAASALVLVAAQTTDDEGHPQPWALYDTGQAVAHLTTQAEHEGLSVHQLGGFDKQAATRSFDLAGTLAPVVVLAVGVRGDERILSGALAERERAQRTRLPLEQIVLSGPAYDDPRLPLSA
ncbi:MAG: nitroreductase family protein [Actinomycetes bacterium]